jgi:hypothetical protein
LREGEMKMTGKMKWLIALVVAGLLVIIITGVVMAAGPTITPGLTPNSTGQLGCDNCTGQRVGNGVGFGGGMDEDLSKMIGLTSDQIREQREAGKSLVQIAASKGVTEEALINAILQDKKEMLKSMVDAKRITQEQLNQRVEIMKQQIKESVNRTTIGPSENRGVGYGRVGGMMGERGMGMRGFGRGTN